MLLQQTAEAGQADFNLRGVYDVEAWVQAVQDNRRLHAAQLSAILSTLTVLHSTSMQLRWRAVLGRRCLTAVQLWAIFISSGVRDLLSARTAYLVMLCPAHLTL